MSMACLRLSMAGVCRRGTGNLRVVEHPLVAEAQAKSARLAVGGAKHRAVVSLLGIMYLGFMAKDTGKGSRIGAVTARTQVRNPKTGDYVKRNETPGSPQKGQFMDVKEDGKPFKGIAKEPDKRRTRAK